MTDPVAVHPTAVSVVPIGGQPVTAAFGPLLGGFLQNPLQAQDQGLPASEAIYVDVVNPAGLHETVTTTRIEPGGLFTFPENLAGNVSVNAASSGHKFSGIVFQPSAPFPPAPQAGSFPPAGPTTLTAVIPSFLYEEYQDDDDLQAFVAAYNASGQSYVSWFATVPLAVYTDPAIAGLLLDWVAEGLYGMIRPTLSSGRNRDLGPLNTYTPNQLAPNQRKRIGPRDITVTSDDIFKRIMTWNLYRGDGNVFNVRWLKRRIQRFLTGENGSAPNIDETYKISVTYGAGIIAIRITVGTRSVLGGAFPNRFGCNRLTPNALTTSFVPGSTHFPLEPVLKEAIESGVLQLPFQYQVTVAI